MQLLEVKVFYLAMPLAQVCDTPQQDRLQLPIHHVLESHHALDSHHVLDQKPEGCSSQHQLDSLDSDECPAPEKLLALMPLPPCSPD